MKLEYDIKSEGKCIGIAQVIPSGLYLDILCKCCPLGGIIRIVADCGGRKENIGICVPEGHKMVIRTRIPKKRLEKLQGFEAVIERQGEWLPIVDGKPISFLHKMVDARFHPRNGKPGFLIQQAKPCKNPQER